MLKRVVVLLFAVLAFSANSVSAQMSNFGRDFYFGRIEPKIQCVSGPQQVSILVSSPNQCRITLSYFDESGNELRAESRYIRPAYSSQFQLDPMYTVPQSRNGEIPEYKAYHIHGDQPFSVQYLSTGSNASALTMVLPTQVLGKDYVVASAPSNAGRGAPSNSSYPCLDSASSEFMIIAPYDSTHVVITPNGTTLTSRIGTSSGVNSDGSPHPFNVTLHRGQVYLVKSQHTDESTDESGSVISSDRPIAVIGANEDAHIGGDANANDRRNLLLQQMIPVKYWTSGDHISMPFVESNPVSVGDANAGERYKIYTWDTIVNSVKLNAGTGGTSNDQISRYASSTFENVTNAATVSSTSGTPIMVEQYDYRQINTDAPFPAPTMMNVIPLDGFTTLSTFAVPYELGTARMRYINIIGRRSAFSSMKLWKDGVKQKYLTVLPTSGSDYSIPGHTGLIGRRFEVTPGSYMITCDSAFELYQLGYGENVYYDGYYEYASPTNAAFHAIGPPVIPHLSATLNCSVWTIRASSSAASPLTQVDILRDTMGIVVRRPGAVPGYVSTNVGFISNDIPVTPGDTLVTTEIGVLDPTQDAEAYIVALNESGADSVVHLSYYAPNLVYSDPYIRFGYVRNDGDSCTNVSIRNITLRGGPATLIDSIGLQFGNKGFRIHLSQALPSYIKAADSLVVSVCFTPNDTLIHSDTIRIYGPCYGATLSLSGRGTSSAIDAYDEDFGRVPVGATACRPIRISNIGPAPLTLTKHWTINGSTNFTLADTAKLPLTIRDNQWVELNVCYTPRTGGDDSATIVWASDGYNGKPKSFSRLRGTGLVSGLGWNQQYAWFATQGHDVHRLYLRNTGRYASTALIDSVDFSGPDALEFSIADNQIKYLPLGNFDMAVGDSLWIDVKLNPDFTKGAYSRRDTLIAYGRNSTVKVVLIGEIGDLAVAGKQEGSFTIIPNPAEASNISIGVPASFQTDATIEVFDVLGNSLMKWKAVGNSNAVSIATLESGTYFIRISDERHAETRTLKVVH